MKPSSTNRSSVHSVVLIICLLSLILTSIFLSRRSIHDIQQASASIYKDRLVPTGILVSLTATIYRKRLLLETYALATQKPNRELMNSSFDRLNRRIDSLNVEFEHTSLTIKEADQFRLLKRQLALYNQSEGELMARMIDQSLGQQTLFSGSSSIAFSEVAQRLDELASLQLTVGADLLGESRGTTNYIYVLTALQIGLVLMIGLSLFWHRFY